MSAVTALTKDTFEETVSENDTVIIDFWADWCGPCKSFAPVYEEAAGRHTDVVFTKVDTEDQQELSQALSIRAMPTLMIFRDGIQIYAEPGAVPGHALDDLLGQVKELDMDEVRAKIAEHADEDHDHDHSGDSSPAAAAANTAE